MSGVGIIPFPLHSLGGMVFLLFESMITELDFLLPVELVNYVFVQLVPQCLLKYVA